MGAIRAKHPLHLTNSALKGFRPPPDADIISDTKLPGFGLRTRGKSSEAAWTWIYSYRIKGSGRQPRLTFGRYLDLTPEQARKRAEEAARKANGSDDLWAKAQAARATAAAERGRPSMSRLWEEYWSAEGSLKKSSKSYQQLWDNHLQTWFGSKKVSAITGPEVERFKAAKLATPGAANRALALLSRMMTLAVRWGYRGGCDPQHPVKGVARYPETQSEFYFSEDQLGRIIEAADAYESRGVGFAIRMLAFTGARAGEVLGAHWGQFQPMPDGRLLWTVESTNTKVGRPVSRALDADLAKRLLEWRPKSLALSEQPKVLELGAPRWVFPQPNRPAEHINRVAHDWDAIKLAAGVKVGRIHDLRHTAATLIVRTTGSLSAAQFQLGHAT